jgi:hypothetical protein
VENGEGDPILGTGTPKLVVGWILYADFPIVSL